MTATAIQIPTLADLVLKVREVAAERPDYVYMDDRCVYFKGDDVAGYQPACIIGHAASRLGFTHLDMEICSGGETALVQHVVRDLIGKAKLSDRTFPYEVYEGDIMVWLDRVQVAQDGRIWVGYSNLPATSGRLSWGAAVEFADKEMPSVKQVKV